MKVSVFLEIRRRSALSAGLCGKSGHHDSAAQRTGERLIMNNDGRGVAE